jgi:hypothetical protein
MNTLVLETALAVTVIFTLVVVIYDDQQDLKWASKCMHIIGIYPITFRRHVHFCKNNVLL